MINGILEEHKVKRVWTDMTAWTGKHCRMAAPSGGRSVTVDVGKGVGALVDRRCSAYEVLQAWCDEDFKVGHSAPVKYRME